MDPITLAISILGGFVGLIIGGELLVRGASNLAAAAKVPQLIIGLTVVALGTSAPELAVSVQSCFAGKTDLAIGNIVGSNLSNLLLVLGVAAMVAPLAVNRRLFRLDIPVMLAAAAAVLALGYDGSISRGEGITLVIAMVLYLGWTVAEGRRESQATNGQSTEGKALEPELYDVTPHAVQSTVRALISNSACLIGGLILLIGGSGWLVEGCVDLATRLGVGELVIGLTVIAIGTSLPELVISVMAVLRGKRDLAVGNVVGSNILNVLAVLGLSAVVAPDGVNVATQSLQFDIPLMVAISAACLPVFLTGMGISRIEGVFMVLFYLSYLAWLVYSFGVASDPPGMGSLVGFLTPLAVAMVGLMWHSRRQSQLPSE